MLSCRHGDGTRHSDEECSTKVCVWSSLRWYCVVGDFHRRKIFVSRVRVNGARCPLPAALPLVFGSPSVWRGVAWRGVLSCAVPLQIPGREILGNFQDVPAKGTRVGFSLSCTGQTHFSRIVVIFSGVPREGEGEVVIRSDMNVRNGTL